MKATLKLDLELLSGSRSDVLFLEHTVSLKDLVHETNECRQLKEKELVEQSTQAGWRVPHCPLRF